MQTTIQIEVVVDWSEVKAVAVPVLVEVRHQVVEGECYARSILFPVLLGLFFWSLFVIEAGEFLKSGHLVVAGKMRDAGDAWS